MKKRGQITLFIILGILILIGVFGYFYIRGQVVERAVLEELPTVTTIPFEFEPIRLFTQECLEAVGTEAIQKLGNQGGYIDLQEFGIKTSITNPTEADAFQFAPDSNIYVPYWWYLKGPNKCKGNCLFSSLRPPLHRTTAGDDSIEAQIDSYIEREIMACLNEYNAFKLQGYEIDPRGELVSRTIVNSNDILLHIEYPLRVELGDKDSDINEFYAIVPVNLMKIYQFASDITNAQMEHQYLEKQMLDLLTAFSGLNEDKLPPISATTFGTNPSMRWLVSDVKSKIEEILMIYVPAFQIYNTLNFRKRNIPNPIQAMLYQASELPINFSIDSQPYSDIAVGFSYLAWWPIYFDVNSRGGVIKGTNAINDLASLFSIGTTRYNTVYDLSYPVVVEIYDPAALRDKGYIFRFALESNFRNNEPIDETFQGFEGLTVPQASLLCNDNQRNSGEIEIKVVDANTKEPVPDLHIGFQCGEEGCAIGDTNENGSLVSKFPLCAGGLLALRHIDYYTPSLYLSTFLNETVDMPTVEAYPFGSKEIKINKYLFIKEEKETREVSDILDPGQTIESTMEETEGEAKIIIIPAAFDEPADEVRVLFTKVNDFEGDPEHIAVAQVKPNQTSSLNLVPGTYEVSLDLLYHKPFVIPEDEREAGTWPLQEEYTIPAVEIDDNYLKGGAVFDESTGYVIITPEDLYSNKTLNLYVIDTGIPNVVEQINDMDMIRAWTTKHRSMLEPKFI